MRLDGNEVEVAIACHMVDGPAAHRTARGIFVFRPPPWEEDVLMKVDAILTIYERRFGAMPACPAVIFEGAEMEDGVPLLPCGVPSMTTMVPFTVTVAVNRGSRATAIAALAHEWAHAVSWAKAGDPDVHHVMHADLWNMADAFCSVLAEKEGKDL